MFLKNRESSLPSNPCQRVSETFELGVLRGGCQESGGPRRGVWEVEESSWVGSPLSALNRTARFTPSKHCLAVPLRGFIHPAGICWIIILCQMPETGQEGGCREAGGVVMFEGEWMRLSVQGTEYSGWLVESSASCCYLKDQPGPLSPLLSLLSLSVPRLSHPWSWLGDFAPALPMPGELSPQIFTGLVPPHLLRGPSPIPPPHSSSLTFKISSEHLSRSRMILFVSCVYWLSLPSTSGIGTLGQESCLACSLWSFQCLKWCLAHSRCSISHHCWMERNKRENRRHITSSMEEQ